ncbi:MAG: cupredoxin family copper-binding protein [Microgenomates group bacterium]
MNSKILTGIAILVLLSGGLYYYLQQQYQSIAPPNVNENIAQNQNEAKPNEIAIQNFTFNPSPLTVKAGTTVTWINNESTAHSIKSNTFNSTDLDQGGVFSYTFNTAGNFDYSCGIHPSMTGKIVVE